MIPNKSPFAVMLHVSVVTANDGCVVIFLNKLKLSPLFVISGRETKKEAYRFKYLVYIVLKRRYFIGPN